MNKKFFLVFFPVLVGLCSSAFAVTKCVKLSSSATCGSGNFMGQVDWSSTCTVSGTSVDVKGVSVCSSQSGSKQGEVADTLSRSSTASENVHCWCKMVSPAVSRWVYYGNAGGNCGHYCSTDCTSGLSGYLTTFRTSMFSSLSD